MEVFDTDSESDIGVDPLEFEEVNFDDLSLEQETIDDFVEWAIFDDQQNIIDLTMGDFGETDMVHPAIVLSSLTLQLQRKSTT